MLLSAQIKFNILDLHVSSEHLADDNMHMHYRFPDRIMNSILNHFDRVNNIVLSTPTPSDPSSTSSTVTSSTSDQVKASKK